MADKKKVFWLIQQNTYVGGIETVTTQLANMLCDDFDITVISAARLANQSIYKLNEKIKLESLDIPITFMQFDKFLKTYLSKRQFGKFLKLLFSSLHRFCLGRLAYRKRLTKLVDKKSMLIVTSQELLAYVPRNYYCYEHFHFNSTFYKSFVTQLLRLTLRKPNYKIFLSKSTQEVLDKKKDKSTYIYNPIRYERELHTSFHNNNLIFIGRLEEIKDPMLLLKSIKEFDSYNIPYKLRILGNGSKRSTMEDYIKKNNLKNIEIIDNCFDVKPYLIDSDLLLCTSYSEGLPLVSLEANSLSVPLLWVDVLDPIPDIVNEGYNGFIVKTRDPKEYARKIKDILLDKEKLIEMKRNSYEMADKFSRSAIKEKWVSLISNHYNKVG